jgi:hypothetical protein
MWAQGQPEQRTHGTHGQHTAAALVNKLHDPLVHADVKGRLATMTLLKKCSTPRIAAQHNGIVPVYLEIDHVQALHPYHRDREDAHVSIKTEFEYVLK